MIIERVRRNHNNVTANKYIINLIIDLLIVISLVIEKNVHLSDNLMVLNIY